MSAMLTSVMHHGYALPRLKVRHLAWLNPVGLPSRDRVPKFTPQSGVASHRPIGTKTFLFPPLRLVGRTSHESKK
ncbi:hypothetical protein EAG_13926 [Camponotus floridanus]|uniref:Uncharacterized protein n=1 Tax=Camponotus floridanus TaxID=104421 RepID=E2ABC8_CAMFO|nr:hypothetical protein EAG_13926 [Camponotus floridanus]